jgi:hypothetical protein
MTSSDSLSTTVKVDDVAPNAIWAPSQGLRFNTGKLRYDLLPPDALEELVRVFTMGAEKYAPRNWEKGLSWMDCYASMMRHAQQWVKGEDRDEESGHLHTAHVQWNAMALTTFMLRGTGQDDRVKFE